MILHEETIRKYNIDPNSTGKFSSRIIIAKCDICGIIFEKSSEKIFMARRNSESEIDTCCGKKCIVKKRENSTMKTYGVTNAGLSPEIRRRVQKTCLQKFGTIEAMSSSEIQTRSKQGCLDKYGVDNVFRLPSIIEKIKQTNLIKYGLEYSKSSETVKNNTHQNNVKKYGVIHPMMLPEISRKTSMTWCKKIYDKLLENTSIIPQFSQTEFIGFNKGKLYQFKCTKCGNEFENNYIGVQCYKCNPMPRSQIENELKEFIQKIYNGIIRFNCRKEFDNKFEIDIYLPKEKIAIELNGNYYHSEIAGGKSKLYHLNKTEKCKDRGIYLIQIFEDEWINKKEIVKRKLSHILNISIENSIYARKCTLREISFPDGCQFLNMYHIQGSDKSSIHIGAYYNSELVSVMTFGKLRKIMGYKKSHFNDTYELIRFATSKNVVGIAGKLLSYFIKKYSPRKIVSYADRRWSKGNLYEKIGFQKVSDGVPNYWYINKHNYQKRFHRFAFRKTELSKKLQTFDPILTEWENMQLNGWDRIWDCGSLKYEWTNP